MRDTGMGSWPTRRARMTPDAVALIQHGRDWTYGEIEAYANGLAHSLRERGVERGDRVAYLGLNSPSFVIVMFAVAKLGAITVPLNTRLAPPETAYILSDSDARLLIWDTGFEAVVESPEITPLGLDLIPVHQSGGRQSGGSPTVSELWQAGSSTPIDEPVDRSEVFMIQYTSGTSGRPKGVMLSHDNIHWNVYNVLVDLDLTSREVALVSAPLFHTAALNQLFFPTFLKGGRCLIEEKWDPGRALHLIESDKVTFLFGVTSMYLSLTQHPNWESTDLSSLNVTMSGGSPIPESLLRTWLDRGQVLIQGYGLTEASPGLTMLRAKESLDKVGSAGTACFFADVQVTDPFGAPVPVGEPGEVLGQGPNVTTGYWRNDEATREAFTADGWLRTGDLARVDDDGYLTLVDRVKDLIISGGENIYPAEVEAAIHTHPAVAEVAVFGIPDNTWGEVGQAVVTLRPGTPATTGELIDHLQGRIARYKIPKELTIVDELPHNASGKLIKGPLRQRYRDRRDSGQRDSGQHDSGQRNSRTEETP